MMFVRMQHDYRGHLVDLKVVDKLANLVSIDSRKLNVTETGRHLADHLLEKLRTIIPLGFDQHQN